MEGPWLKEKKGLLDRPRHALGSFLKYVSQSAASSAKFLHQTIPESKAGNNPESAFKREYPRDPQPQSSNMPIAASKGVPCLGRASCLNTNMPALNLAATFKLDSRVLKAHHGYSVTVEPTDARCLHKVLSYVKAFEYEYNRVKTSKESDKQHNLVSIRIAKQVSGAVTLGNPHHRDISGSTLVPSPPSTSPTSPRSPVQGTLTDKEGDLLQNHHQRSGGTGPFDLPEFPEEFKTPHEPSEGVRVHNNQLRAQIGQLKAEIQSLKKERKQKVHTLKVSNPQLSGSYGNENVVDGADRMIANLETRIDALAYCKNDLALRLGTSEEHVARLRLLLKSATDHYTKQNSTSTLVIAKQQNNAESFSEAVETQKNLTQEANDQLKSVTATYELKLKDQVEYYQASLASLKDNGKIPFEKENKLQEEIEARLRKGVKIRFRDKFNDATKKQAKLRKQADARLEKRLTNMKNRGQQLVKQYAYLGIGLLKYAILWEKMFASEGFCFENEEYDLFIAKARRQLVYFRPEDDNVFFYGEEEVEEEEGEDEEEEEEAEADACDYEGGYRREGLGSRLAIEWRPAGTAEDPDELDVSECAETDLEEEVQTAKNLLAMQALESYLRKIIHRDETEASAGSVAESETVGQHLKTGIAMTLSHGEILGLHLHPEDENLASMAQQEVKHDIKAVPLNSDGHNSIHEADAAFERTMRQNSEVKTSPLDDITLGDLAWQMVVANGEGPSRADHGAQADATRSRALTSFDRRFLYDSVYLRCWGKHRATNINEASKTLSEEASLAGQTVEDGEHNASLDDSAVSLEGAHNEGPNASPPPSDDDNSNQQSLRVGNASCLQKEGEAAQELITQMDRVPSIFQDSNHHGGRKFHSRPPTSQTSCQLADDAPKQKNPENPRSSSAGPEANLIFGSYQTHNAKTTSPTNAAVLNLNIDAVADTSHPPAFTTPQSSPKPTPTASQPVQPELKTKLGKTRAQVEAEVAVALAARKLEEEGPTTARKAKKEKDAVAGKAEGEKKVAVPDRRKTKAERRAAAIKAQEEATEELRAASKKKKAKSGRR